VFDPTEAIRRIRARSTLPRSYVKPTRHIHDIVSPKRKRGVCATGRSSRRAISQSTRSRVSCASALGNTAGTSNFQHLGEVKPRSDTVSGEGVFHTLRSANWRAAETFVKMFGYAVLNMNGVSADGQDNSRSDFVVKASEQLSGHKIEDC